MKAVVCQDSHPHLHPQCKYHHLQQNTAQNTVWQISVYVHVLTTVQWWSARGHVMRVWRAGYGKLLPRSPLSACYYGNHTTATSLLTDQYKRNYLFIDMYNQASVKPSLIGNHSHIHLYIIDLIILKWEWTSNKCTYVILIKHWHTWHMSNMGPGIQIQGEKGTIFSHNPVKKLPSFWQEQKSKEY